VLTEMNKTNEFPDPDEGFSFSDDL